MKKQYRIKVRPVYYVYTNAESAEEAINLMLHQYGNDSEVTIESECQLDDATDESEKHPYVERDRITLPYEIVSADESTTVINVYSLMNEWIDYDFIVPTDMKHRALEALSEAYDAWWDDDTGLTMFEELEFALKDAGIPFTSVVNEEED